MAEEPSTEPNQEKTKPHHLIAIARTRIRAVYQALSWETLKAAVNASLNNAAKLLWIALAILIFISVVRNLSTDLVVIEPISVPESFSKNGFTPEVVGRRLRDAISNYLAKAGSRMQTLSIAPREELPNIVVPKVDLSLDTIVSSIRSVLHYGSRLTVSGELTIRNELVWLRLRIDGQQVYSSPEGFDPGSLDEPFSAALPAIVEQIRPYVLASAMYEIDPVQAAEKAGDIIARLPPSDINVQWSYVLIANFLADQQEYAKAESVLRKAIRLNYANSAAHASLGNVLRLRGRYNEAAAEHHRAIKIEPKSAAPYFGLGNLLADKQNFDGAIREYRRAVELEPKNAFLRYHLGGTLFLQGKLEEATVEYRHATWLDPKNPVFHSSLGMALRAQRKFDDAAVEYRRAVEFAPKSAGWRVDLGSVMHDQGKVDEAMAEFRAAMKIDPDYVDSYLEAGNVLQEQGKVDDAIAEYRHAIAIDPKNADAHNKLGLVLSNQGKLDDAIAEYRLAVEIDPKNAVVHNNLGGALRSQGRLDDAIEEYREAIQVDPDSRKARNGLEEALREKRSARPE